ncbi:hypothetical protein FA15DRAFT_675061 [Coprinopsis marcescibilis]|uniref:Secreted protein n=1 Tax=Coprinopsis marcescibilis TaxID=230819 RepID=A0A5C3KF98_COPMA|nr:hypothetical protein FA15DRAFT_675061 [Coprinopsis marcescibilis]
MVPPLVFLRSSAFGVFHSLVGALQVCGHLNGDTSHQPRSHSSISEAGKRSRTISTVPESYAFLLSGVVHVGCAMQEHASPR